MSSSNSSAPQSPPPKNTTPASAAPPPSPEDPSSPPTTNTSSSPAPSSSSPPPAPFNSHGAPVSPAGIPTPPKQSSRGPGDSSSSSQESVHRVSPAEIVFAAAGAAALLALLVAACVCCSRRTAPRRRRKPQNPMHFYADTTSGHKGNSTYYTSGPQPQWRSDTGAGPSTSTSGQAGGSLHVPPDMNPGVYSAPHGQSLPPPARHQALGLSKGTFTYDELAAATEGFSQANLLGQGGFGYVHKGVLPCGKAVAVKQLKSGSGQGEREFQAEVDIISRVHHRHLVSLVGYCIAGASRMLVYEFVPNKTLEFHLHGKGLPPMTWATRLRMALGSAKGLAYLHEDCQPRIIHRDIKSANILLDDNFEAMVADFGLAKLLASDDNSTHVSTRVMGTFGYLAPEYASSGKLTEKSDVFSYGVVLLELLTGRRPVDADNTGHSFLEDGLVDWARPALSRALAGGDYGAVADPRLDGGYDTVEMACVAASAAACVRQSSKKRPKMSQIVRALEGDMSLEDLNEGVRPGQSMLFGEAVASG